MRAGVASPFVRRARGRSERPPHFAVVCVHGASGARPHRKETSHPRFRAAGPTDSLRAKTHRNGTPRSTVCARCGRARVRAPNRR
jgi:hypothetical protein